MAAAGRDGKGNPGLGTGIGRWETALQCQGPMAIQDAPGVPPARRVYLPVASGRQPQLEQPLKIDG